MLNLLLILLSPSPLAGEGGGEGYMDDGWDWGLANMRVPSEGQGILTGESPEMVEVPPKAR